MKKSKYLFYLIMVVSTLITLSSNNWISMWIGLEMNMMAFVPIMINKNNKLSSEAAMIYFLIQSISSMILMAMVLYTMCKYLISWKIVQVIMVSSMLIKLGAAPFHLWLPEIMSKIEWLSGAILMTWQKIAPLNMISNMNQSYLINLSILMSVLVGSLGGINQSSLRKLLGYSSINHLGWMLAINKNMNLWMFYLTIYSVIMWSMCMMFLKNKIYFINQLNSVNFSNPDKFCLFIMMMSVGGLPPFIGFLPKWVTIQSMMLQNETFIVFFMIMMSLITLIYYLRIMNNMYMMSNVSVKWFYNHNNNWSSYFNIIINISLPIFYIIDMI
uniref:NADH dehydrogenase subunit 2 n=1 Tax=Homalogonia obtusa TaxID=631380 RepID=UPI0022FD7C81|nr:NADH dehydrogenase subunit 2 [Homalogonia obtusa]WBP69667.1 NADH dehydrogenase subunit 2 [Homalogonia obtusa]